MTKRSNRANWGELSYFMRSETGFRCERCGAPERPEGGHTLTVNLVNTVLTNISRANLVVLCRRCQGRLRKISLAELANQLELFEPFELAWLGPHLEALGIPLHGAMVSSRN